MGLYDKILGTPLVYNKLRPFVVGGIDMSPVYDRLQVRAGETVLDVGCGTGVALEHLHGFGRYVGVDTDPIALKFARQRREAGDARVEFVEKLIGADDVRAIAPDVAVLAGLLHHVDDPGCVALLRALAAAPKLRRIVTQDITFLPGRLVNNLFSTLDRGQYPRHPGGYEALVREAGLRVEESAVIPSAPGNTRTAYWVMTIGRPA